MEINVGKTIFMRKKNKWIQNIREYYDRGIKCRQCRFIKWDSFISQFVQPVGGQGTGWGKRVDGGIIILGRCEFPFIRKHENLCNIQVTTNPSKNMKVKFKDFNKSKFLFG